MQILILVESGIMAAALRVIDSIFVGESYPQQGSRKASSGGGWCSSTPRRRTGGILPIRQKDVEFVEHCSQFRL